MQTTVSIPCSRRLRFFSGNSDSAYAGMDVGDFESIGETISITLIIPTDGELQLPPSQANWKQASVFRRRGSNIVWHSCPKRNNAVSDVVRRFHVLTAAQRVQSRSNVNNPFGTNPRVENP